MAVVGEWGEADNDKFAKGFWNCDCGFRNIKANVVCGGQGTRMGCNSPRPTPWKCSCGFKNKPRNTICGGPSNDFGCGNRRPNQSGGSFLKFYQQAFQNSFGQNNQSDWSCMYCGFENGGRNSVCGGINGNLGCKQSRTPSFFGGNQMNQSNRRGGFWTCRCGFKNQSRNSVCGGVNGELGCKKPSPNSNWSCSCGFDNNGRNEVCGGVNGDLGCKKERGTSASGFTNKDWKCACGFFNQAQNSVCGGVKGKLGCNAKRPANWQCPACEFQNSGNNKVCGGSGSLGCNAARPGTDSEADVLPPRPKNGEKRKSDGELPPAKKAKKGCESWTVEQVSEWVEDNFNEDLSESFSNELITGTVLHEMTDEELKNLGMKLGERKQFRKLLEQL